MNPLVQGIITVICAVLASSGFWACIQKRNDKRDNHTQLLVARRVDKGDAERKMLVGLAHDRILFLGMSYINQGYITRDEYENLYEYLYRPYEKMGGNGSAKRVMQEVNKLPIRSQ